METKSNFNSKVCTDRNQSERLLALGLKKETADCVWIEMSKDDWRVDANGWKAYHSIIEEGFFPAWSLHRLWCLLPHSITIVTHFGQYKAGLDLTMDSYQNVSYLEGADEPCYDMSFFANDAYESICKAIEWLIKKGYFPKEYLV
jgi:hypothetical protein